MRAWVVVVLAWLCLAASARAENRLALVIGNDDYQHIDKLQKAVADAKAYAAVLREKGFSVQEGYDLSILPQSGHTTGRYFDKVTFESNIFNMLGDLQRWRLHRSTEQFNCAI
jgi:hypothetical protein